MGEGSSFASLARIGLASLSWKDARRGGVEEVGAGRARLEGEPRAGRESDGAQCETQGPDSGINFRKRTLPPPK